jgi:hypothetical protein
MVVEVGGTVMEVGGTVVVVVMGAGLMVVVGLVVAEVVELEVNVLDSRKRRWPGKLRAHFQVWYSPAQIRLAFQPPTVPLW